MLPMAGMRCIRPISSLIGCIDTDLFLKFTSFCSIWAVLPNGGYGTSGQFKGVPRKPTLMSTGFLTEAREFLVDAGYRDTDLVENCPFTVRAEDGSFRDSTADMVAFAKHPHDMRNACVAVIADSSNSSAALRDLRFLTAPLAIVGSERQVELWSIRKTIPQGYFDVLDRAVWQQRLKTRLSDYSPATIIEAKDDRIQLEFVDAGLGSWTRSIAGVSLASLLEDLIAHGIESLGAANRKNTSAQEAVLRLVFNLFACRALEDKSVVPLQPDATAALKTANTLFSENINPDVMNSQYLPKGLSEDIFKTLRSKFSFATLTTEILAHSYENALVTKDTKHALGIYYTPRSLTDYILRRLPVETISQERRLLWDPCCGCGSFLLAGFDRLSALLPASMSPRERHAYLRKRVVGSDQDQFARELASLALVLTDLHNQNGWKVIQADAKTVQVRQLPGQPTIIASNLPFREIKDGKRREVSAEVLENLIDIAPAGALLGIILPQGFLESGSATNARRKVLKECDVLELALLPAAFFKSAAETVALMLMKRMNGRVSITTVRELRSDDFSRFERTGSFTRTYPARSSDWENEPESRFHVSPMADLWKRLESEFPPLSDFASVDNGIQLKTDDTTSVSDKKRNSSDRPYVDRLTTLRPFAMLTELGIQKTKWIKYGQQLHRARDENIFTQKKVLINATRNAGYTWRIIAAISRQELFFSENFNAVIPLNGKVSLEQLAALLNSPITNAWLDSRCKTRKIKIETVECLPIPQFDERIGKKIDDAVRHIEKAVRQKWEAEEEGLFYDGLEENSDAAAALSEIDSLIYDAYGLAKNDRRSIDVMMSKGRPR